MTTPQLFGRRCTLIIGTARLDGGSADSDGLRVSWRVEKNDKRDPNTATINVWNLNESTRRLLEEKNARVILEAGYDQQTGAIFFGSVYRATTNRQGPDLVTTIETADGGRELAANKAAFSFSKGADAAGAIRQVAAAVGLPVSSGSRIAPYPPRFPNGWAFAGKAADALDALTRAHQLTWSVQDSQIQILDVTPGDGTPDILLTSATGMVGNPERVDVKALDVAADASVKSVAKAKAAEKRVTVNFLLNPLARPGRFLVVRSVDAPSLSGRYLIKDLKIEGDSYGPQWTMQASCVVAP